MNSLLVIGIGAALGLLGAVGIYFDTRVPSRHLIVLAGLLRGILVALITGLSISAHSGWLVGLGWGTLYGTLFGAMQCLSKGAAALQHAVYIIPTSAVTGALSGLLIAWLAF
ncbi:MAG TPA: hypothetical protein VK505_10835 [Steroidobacteraceae bacterium]|jgi:hypothetical protein|nr:hypothetical protein [Steroidobacteraceae bacterium]